MMRYLMNHRDSFRDCQKTRLLSDYSPLKLSENLWFSVDLRENISELICANDLILKGEFGSYLLHLKFKTFLDA